MRIHTLPEKDHENRLVLRGVHLWLTEAMRAGITQKATRLFRHEPRIIRLRVDVASDHRKGVRMFIARGRVEMPGPDLTASVSSSNGYLSINLLIAKLDRMLRRRMTTVLRRRTTGDIREHASYAALA